MTRYQIRFEYLGLNYKGSQKQTNGNTIQDEIEKALRTLIKTNISTIFSGRTDAKVSAKSQSAHFDSEIELNENKFLNSINGILPEDIRVFELNEVDKAFHAQKSAKFRHYCYKIRNSKVNSAFDNVTYFVKYPLNEKRMDEALKQIVGEHDFSAFKSQSDNPAKVCEIYFARAKRSLDGLYINIDIIGNRFLYNMVRTIVGTLLLIEKDSLQPLLMGEILKSKDRQTAGATAPAEGLTLEYVGYDDVLKYINNLKNTNER